MTTALFLAVLALVLLGSARIVLGFRDESRRIDDHITRFNTDHDFRRWENER